MQILYSLQVITREKSSPTRARIHIKRHSPRRVDSGCRDGATETEQNQFHPSENGIKSSRGQSNCEHFSDIAPEPGSRVGGNSLQMRFIELLSINTEKDEAPGAFSVPNDTTQQFPQHKAKTQRPSTLVPHDVSTQNNLPRSRLQVTALRSHSRMFLHPFSRR